MENVKRVMLVIAVFFSAQLVGADSGVYKEELKAWKKKKPYDVMFDKDADGILRGVLRDVDNFKAMTPFQRRLRFMFLSMDSVAVTPASMPKLYGYVASLCEKQGIEMPTVFITKDKWLFNAMAAKLFMSSGGILIGQDLLNEVTDQELEAVVAHEIGHIVHNHINKMLATSIVSSAAAGALMSGALIYKFPTVSGKNVISLFPASLVVGDIISSLIRGKRYERQADQFAYAKVGKGGGLIKFFERLQRKEQKAADDFDITSDVLSSARASLTFNDYLNLNLRYYIAKTGYKINSAFRWFYYHTPFGPHPSPESRIRDAREYTSTEQV